VKRGVDRIYKGTISYNLGENILFDNITHGENYLLLYTNTNNHKYIIQNFMRRMANKNSTLVYISHKTNQLNFTFNVRNHFFNVMSDNIIQDLKSQLEKYFSEMEKNDNALLLIADWASADLRNCKTFLPFLEGIIKKSQGLNPPGWKRKYGETSHKTPFLLVNAFDAANLNAESIQELTKMHSRVYFLQENISTFFLPTISPSLQTIFPKQHILPQNLLEKLVKDNLELVVLLFLEDGDNSGYQILKDIAKHFHCILSQGTLYPLLYQLEKENKIAKKNGKGREIVYSLTEKTKNELKLKKESCLMAYQHLASFFENAGAIKKNNGAVDKK